MASKDEVSSVMNMNRSHLGQISVPRIEEKWEERKKNENFSFVACSAPRAGTEAERGRRRRLGEHSRPENKMLSRLRLLVPASQSLAAASAPRSSLSGRAIEDCRHRRTSRSFGVEGDASSRGFAINLGVWVSSLSPRERAQAGHFCPAYASRYPPQANPQPDPVDSGDTSRDVCAGTAFARWVTTGTAFAQQGAGTAFAQRVTAGTAFAQRVVPQGELCHMCATVLNNVGKLRV